MQAEMLRATVFDLHAEDCERVAQTLREYFTARSLPAEIEEFTGIQPFVLAHKARYDAGTPHDMAFVGVDSMIGAEAARHIREIDAELPMFFVSSVSDFALEAHRLFALNYLTKPVSPLAVEESVSRITMSCYAGHRIPDLLLG
jgi:DNA-binding LytR/AlgR family response regulator